jgi:hypothetical protein
VYDYVVLRDMALYLLVRNLRSFLITRLYDSSRIGDSPNAVSVDKNFRAPPHLKNYEYLQIINNSKFQTILN